MLKKEDVEYSVRSGICDAILEQKIRLVTSFEHKCFYIIEMACGNLAPGYIRVYATPMSRGGMQQLRVAQGDGLGSPGKMLYETTLVENWKVNVRELSEITDKVTGIVWDSCYAEQTNQ